MSGRIDSILAHFWVHVRDLHWVVENGVVSTRTEVRGEETELRLSARSGVIIRGDEVHAFGWSRRQDWVGRLYATAIRLAA